MSFELALSLRERAGSRLIASVRKQLILAADDQHATQQSIADKLGVHRSVINRLLRGTANLTLRTLGELAWALNLEIIIMLRRKAAPVGGNVNAPASYDVSNPVQESKASFFPSQASVQVEW